MLNLKITKDDYKKAIISKADYIKKMHSLHLSLFEYSEFIKNTDISSIEIESDKVTIITRKSKLKLRFDKRDYRSQPLEIMNFDYYEKNEIEMILKLLPEKPVVFDIGAHTGWYALNIARFRQEAKIYAFEPVSLNFCFLRENVKLNSFNGIQIYDFGFSDREGRVNFYVDPAALGNASSMNLARSRNRKKLICRVKKLDDFVKKNLIKKLDFIKCDVEGAELLVFRGAKNTIKKYKPIIFTEMLRKWAAKFHYHPNDIIRMFRNSGYRCFTIQRKRLNEFFQMADKTLETNFIFLHKEKHLAQIRKMTE